MPVSTGLARSSREIGKRNQPERPFAALPAHMQAAGNLVAPLPPLRGAQCLGVAAPQRAAAKVHQKADKAPAARVRRMQGRNAELPGRQTWAHAASKQESAAGSRRRLSTPGNGTRHAARPVLADQAAPYEAGGSRHTVDALYGEGGAAHGHCGCPGWQAHAGSGHSTAVQQAAQQLPRPMLSCAKLQRAAAPASIFLDGRRSAQACRHAAGGGAKSMACR